MKYQVNVKEIWIQSYTVEAQSKAHAKNLVERALTQGTTSLKRGAQRPQKWGYISSEKWDVQQL